MSRRRGFTLIELLVVMGVILALVAILLPATGRVWEAAYAHKCQSNLRTLGQAFLAFASDNDGHLPGSRDMAWTDSNPQHQDWLFGPYSILVIGWEINPTTGKYYTPAEQAQFAPEYGSIWKYVSNGGTPTAPAPAAYAVYRCPSVPFLQVESSTTGGSNGRFDYYAFSSFGGARLKDINPVSQLHFPIQVGAVAPNPLAIVDSNPRMSNGGYYSYSQHVENWPTPLVAQEDSLIWSNTNLDTWGEYCRQMAKVHNGGSYYAAVDGSIHFLIEPDTDPANVWYEGVALWFQNGPASGMPCQLNSDPASPNSSGVAPGGGWGGWSHR